MLLISNCIVLVMTVCRVSCAFTTENVLAVIAMLFTCPYFLFFCRYAQHTLSTICFVHYCTLKGMAVTRCSLNKLFVYCAAQRVSYRWSVRRDDLQDDTHRPAAILRHLPRLSYRIFAGYNSDISWRFCVIFRSWYCLQNPNQDSRRHQTSSTGWCRSLVSQFA